MRLLPWLLFAAATMIPVTSLEGKSLERPKRESGEKKIVCYYTNWSVYRPGTAKFSPQNINPYLCTHLIYAFGGLSKDNALKPFDKYQDIEQGGYAKFNGLKTYNKNLKTMLAIGGWNEGSARFSPLVADAERRRELVKNTVKFLRQNHFDGLDLDWEYPSFRDGGKARDRDNYATLVQEFRQEFERESEKTGRTRLLLTMAVPAGIEYIDKGYDVPKLNKYLDWMNILSYDYHSAFEPAINHHSPLFSLEEDDEYNFDAQLSIDYTVKHYIKLGADRNKLVLGIPTYGRSYTLFNPDATEIGSPADGPGEQGEATREKGYLAYYEICERISSGGWSQESPYPDAMGPYAFKENQWVGYDDEEIARAKAKYVNEMDLGGIMFWSIDNDDFRGKCHGKAYPLIEAAKEALLASSNELVPRLGKSESGRSSSKKQGQTGKSKSRGSRIRTKTTTEASKSKSSGRTTTPQPPTTPDPGSDFVCKDEGFFPHPRDCKKYFWCLDSGPSSLGIVAHQFTCPSGLVFNKVSDSCDYARNVVCKNKAEPSATTTTTTSTTTARTTTAKTRLIITASPPRTTTTTTTTEEPESEEEEGEEEDPGTIKELIDLIKKLGGIEQLEKQLNLQNSDAKEKIKPSLYTKVLKARPANRFRGVINDEEFSTPRYSSVFRNRPNVPQGSSTEGTSRRYERPKYVTIQRNRPTRKPIEAEDESEEEEEGEEDETVEEVQPKRMEGFTRPLRRRPVVESSTTEKEYVTLRRTRPRKEKEEGSTTSKYKSVSRFRSTTETSREEDDEEVVLSSSSEEGDDDEDGGGVRDSEEQLHEPRQEEEKEENEPVTRNYKKYSSVKRDRKIVEADEEEKKVSGQNGPNESEGERLSLTTTSEITPNGRDAVNNVQKLTSPKYVEIRRTQSPATKSLAKDVNIVNNTPETDRESKPINVEETDRVKSEENDFEVEPTTQSVRRVYRPLFRSTTIERAESSTTEESVNKEGGFQRSGGRFRPTTESSPTPESKPSYSRHKAINRSTTEKPGPNENNALFRSLKRERTSGSTTTTTTIDPPETTSTNGAAQRRFQFAPRNKPAIFSTKPAQSTTESFQITVPDLPNQGLAENALDTSDKQSSLLPSSATPKTPVIEFSTAANTVINEPENEEAVFGKNIFFPTIRHFDPTTSTETSVVTSVTESLFTERKRIMVHRKDFNFENDVSFTTTTPAELYEEVTRPSFRTTEYQSVPKSMETTTALSEEVTRSSFKQYKNPLKSVTPKTDKAKDFRRRRYKTKSSTTTTTTTEEPSKPQQRYVPKKTRVFKKIVSTEPPEPTIALTQRARFVPKNRPRPVEQYSIEPLNSLNLRFSNTRKRKIVSKKEDVDEDGSGGDLEVEQSSSYYGDEFENNGRYESGSRFWQTLEKNYLNDVFVFDQPAAAAGRVESKGKGKEEFSNSVYVPKTTDSSLSLSNKGKVNINANEAVTPAFEDLRTRISLPHQSSIGATEKPDYDSSYFQQSTDSGTTPYNKYNSDFNFFSFGTPSIRIPEAAIGNEQASETNGYLVKESTSEEDNNSNNNQIVTKPLLVTPEVSERGTEKYSSSTTDFGSTRGGIETSIYTIDPALYNFETFGTRSQEADSVSYSPKAQTGETTTPIVVADSNDDSINNFPISNTGTSDNQFDRDSEAEKTDPEDDPDFHPSSITTRKRISNYVYTSNANFKTSRSRAGPLNSTDGENAIEKVKISTVDSNEEVQSNDANVGNSGRQKFKIFKIKSRKFNGGTREKNANETLDKKPTPGSEAGEQNNKIYSSNSNLRNLRNRYEDANEVSAKETNSQIEEETEEKETPEGKTLTRLEIRERNRKIFSLNANFRKLRTRYENASELSTNETNLQISSEEEDETEGKETPEGNTPTRLGIRERNSKIFSPNANFRKLRNRNEIANDVSAKKTSSTAGSDVEDETDSKNPSNANLDTRKFRKFGRNGQAGRTTEVGTIAEASSSTVSSEMKEVPQRPRFQFARPRSGRFNTKSTEETIATSTVSTSRFGSTKEPSSSTLPSNPSQSTARIKFGETESEEATEGSASEGSRSNELPSTDVSGVTSKRNYETLSPPFVGDSTAPWMTFETLSSQIGKGSTVAVTSFETPLSTPQTGEGSTSPGTSWFTVSSSSEHFSDPSIGSTFGLKTDSTHGVTSSASSPVISTDRSEFSTTAQLSTSSSTIGQTVGSTEFSFVPSTNGFTRFRSTIPSLASTRSTEESSESTPVPINPPQTSSRILRKRIKINRKDKTSLADTNESDESEVLKSNSTSARQGFRQTATETISDSANPTGNQQESIPENPSKPRRNFRVIKTRIRTKNNSTVETPITNGEETTQSDASFSSVSGVGESDISDSGTGNGTVGKFSKKGKRVLVRSKPVSRQTRLESKEKEDESREETETTEGPSSTTSRITTSRRFNQELYTGARNNVRPTTTTTTTAAPIFASERPERRRPLVGGRRFRKERRPTTVKYETQTEASSTTLRSSTLLRRRSRPTTITTTTTTESPYVEVEEGTSLEESKTIDESPDFQDLADPAVVAIHTLATVPPGSISTGRPLTYFGPPDTYTVHVTESDIESITPGRISTTEPGTARPTSILTLKPFTIPVITRQPVKQTPFPIRTSSSFTGLGSSLGREESHVERDEPEKPRRLEIVSKSRPVNTVTSSPTPKAVPAKPRQPKPFSKVNKQVVQTVVPSEPPDYEYYDDDENPLANIPASALKVKVHSNGYIECLDRGNFPHPFSCKKFISCARMENNELLGWEYTCPKHLSFDPVGGICNWSAGLGCQH